MKIILNSQVRRVFDPSVGALESGTYRSPFRSLAAIASISVLGMLGCTQTPVAQIAGVPTASQASAFPMASGGGTMAHMDSQMKMMRETHDQMMKAESPEERKALMATHMKQMQDGMTMMGGMGKGGMQGMAPMGGDMAARQQLMEKRMEMMQSMMQMMMMDRMPASSSKQ